MLPGASALLTVLALFACTKCATAAVNFTASALEDFNITDDSSYLTVNKNGKTVYMSEELMRKLQEELETWHWTPWLRTRTVVEDDVVKEICPYGYDSIGSFPDSIFTEEQLRMGAFLLYALFGMYSFTLLAVVCNDYFIPCVEYICEDLKIPQNVAAATFMAVATSCPEFFVNVISTFLTESDMGIGTIIGSAIFNALGVAAVGGLAAVSPIAIDMRPVTRDVFVYMVNVSVLVVIVWDGQVDWYEAMVLGILYVLYFVVMFNSMRLFALFDKIVGNCCTTNKSIDETKGDENEKSVEDGLDNKAYNNDEPNHVALSEKVSISSISISSISKDDVEEKKPKKKRGIFTFPKGKSILFQIGWWYTLPLRTVLGFTIPSPVSCRKFYPLAFIMCIVWIGINSYFVSWSMTVIGNTFLIPDSVMGMTFLAFGGCLPEACSIFIMSRRGEGGIGVSNALGANSLAILFALGVPWLIRTLTLVAQGAEQQAVLINSAGIDFVVGSLLLAVVLLWLVLFIGKFMLRKSVGLVLACLYAIFITFAILVEMNIILGQTFGIC